MAPWAYAAPPAGASPPSGGDARLGSPVEHYLYRAPTGDVSVIVDYYSAPPDAPTVSADGLVVRYTTYDDGNHQWKRTRGTPSSVILYRVNEILEADQGTSILLCGTEREADHLRALEGDAHILGTTWLGGDLCAKACDYSALQGRSVVLCPMYSDSSLRAMAGVVAVLHKLGIETTILDPRKMQERPGWSIRSVHNVEELNAVLGQAHGITVAPPDMFRTPLPLPQSKLGLVTRWNEWGFQTNERGKPFENLNNAHKYLVAHPEDYGNIWMDVYRRQIRVGDPGVDAEWNDADDVRLQLILQQDAGLFTIGSKAAHDAVLYFAMSHPRHPYREWRESLKWDGVERVDLAFTRGWGCPNDEYHRALSRCFLIQQARRIMEPGCQADLMVIFEGTTGIGKSSALIALFGEDQVVAPTAMFGQKDFYQQILGKAIVEIADLANFKGAHLESIKADITRRCDRFRPPYGRVQEDFDRQCVFVGTTEGSEWNEDPNLTARRFPPAECGAIDLQYLRDNRHQLLAEAWSRAKAGEPYWELPQKIAAEKQLSRVAADPWDAKVTSYIASRRTTTVPDIASDALGIELAHMDVIMQRRLAKILKRNGWLPRRDKNTRWWEKRIGADGQTLPAPDKSPSDSF